MGRMILFLELADKRGPTFEQIEIVYL